MLISDVCHNYQFFKKIILINVTYNTIGSCTFVKNTFLCIKGIQHANYMNDSNKKIVLCLLSVSQTFNSFILKLIW